MTVFRKLFIAAALVATGLGVAALLGEPISIKPAFRTASARPQPPLVVASPVRSGMANSVQLLPDSVATQAAVRSSESPSLVAPLAPVFAAPATNDDLQVSTSVAAVQTPVAARLGNIAPQAQLRNEAPRPIGNEPRSPATIRRAPPVASENPSSAREVNAYQVTSNWPAPQSLAAGFTSDGTSTPATVATYEAPANVTDNRQVGPPPWPAAAERDGPRMHVIADGDSLEKLAGRYLDDPHRSSEIYEFNRELLSSPDLLPIGAELKMPERSARTAWDRQGRRTDVPNEMVREASSSNLVPVRAVSSFDGIVPRAQLARPLPVE